MAVWCVEVLEQIADTKFERTCLGSLVHRFVMSLNFANWNTRQARAWCATSAKANGCCLFGELSKTTSRELPDLLACGNAFEKKCCSISEDVVKTKKMDLARSLRVKGGKFAAYRDLMRVVESNLSCRIQIHFFVINLVWRTAARHQTSVILRKIGDDAAVNVGVKRKRNHEPELRTRKNRRMV